MTVYYLHPSFKKNGHDRYSSVQMIIPDETSGIRFKDDLWKNFRGRTLNEIWPKTIKYQYLPRKNPRGDLLRDFQSSPYLILSSRAVDALRDLLEPEGEFYPIECDENPLFAWWPNKLLDALDTTRAKIIWLEVGTKKKFFRIGRYWFRQEIIANIPIFQIANDPGFFVTDKFLQRVRERKLKGFGFRKLWSPEEGSTHSEYVIGPWPEGEDLNF